MSSPRYDWWPYVKGMIRRYPSLKERYDELRETGITAQLTGMPRSGNLSNPTETAALRELSPVNQREYEAVRKAVETIRGCRDGKERLEVIRLVLWDQSHTLAGAALKVSYSEPTVWRWHRDFIRLVARNFGLLDES